MKTAKRIYKMISSMKTGLSLLGLIALVSGVGTVVSPGGFFDTTVFKLLLLLLLLNMVLCTINRVFFFKSVSTKKKNRKGFLRQLGILLLHAGIVVILVGGVVYSFFGQYKQVPISTGETVNLSYYMILDEPISIKLNSFKIDTNDDGSVSQYYADLTILEDDKVQEQEIISVNHPLVYKNIKAYQESYGFQIKTRVIHGSDIGPEQLLFQEDLIELPDSKRIVKVYRYFPDYDPTKGMNQTSNKEGDARIVYSVYENDQLLGVGAAKFGSQIEIDKDQYVVFDGVEPYSVLRVKSDPGLSLVFIGSLLFMLGITLNLFFAPVRKTRQQTQQQDTDSDDEKENITRQEVTQ